MKAINYKTFIFTNITFLLMVLISTSSYAKIYKWVDKKGQTHYTAHPPLPDQVRSESVNIEKQIKANAGKAQPTEGEKPENNDKKGPEEAKLSGPNPKLVEYCSKQRKNLKTLEENFRNKWIDEKGIETRLTQEQRKEKAESLVAKIKQDCSDIPEAKNP